MPAATQDYSFHCRINHTIDKEIIAIALTRLLKASIIQYHNENPAKLAIKDWNNIIWRLLANSDLMRIHCPLGYNPAAYNLCKNQELITPSMAAHSHVQFLKRSLWRLVASINSICSNITQKSLCVKLCMSYTKFKQHMPSRLKSQGG